MNTRAYVIYNRTLIKFLTSLVKNTDDVQLIQNDMLNSFGTLIETYNKNNDNNKDPNMLLLFSALLEKIRAQNFSFNKSVIDTITFAINHKTPSMSETGLETLLILLQKVITVKNIDYQNIVDPFFKNYFLLLLGDVFHTMTDGFHQNGFKLQVKVMQILIRVIDEKVIKENLFDENQNNKTFFLNRLLTEILQNFQNIKQTQGEALCLAMINSCSDDHKFKSVMRDFLVSLKSFIGNNEALWEEEKRKELELAQRLEEQKKSFLPGPQYDMQINAGNYQDNNMNL